LDSPLDDELPSDFDTTAIYRRANRPGFNLEPQAAIALAAQSCRQWHPDSDRGDKTVRGVSLWGADVV